MVTFPVEHTHGSNDTLGRPQLHRPDYFLLQSVGFALFLNETDGVFQRPVWRRVVELDLGVAANGKNITSVFRIVLAKFETVRRKHREFAELKHGLPQSGRRESFGSDD